MEEGLARKLEEYGRPGGGLSSQAQQQREQVRSGPDGGAGRDGDVSGGGAARGGERDAGPERPVPAERERPGGARGGRAEEEGTAGDGTPPYENDIDRVPETFDAAEHATSSEGLTQREAAVGDGALAKENDTSNINSQREKLSESLGTPDDCVNPTNPTPPSKKHRANPAGAEGDAAGDRGAQVPKASHIPSR